MRSLAVKAPRNAANSVLMELKRRGVLNPSLKIKQANNYVLIPVKEPVDGFELVYDDFETKKRTISLKECLKEKLGEGDWPRSFSLIGDIAIVSIREDFSEELKRAIADCLLSNTKARAVWGKVETVGKERVAKLVHLGGEEVTETVYKENGLVFKVDVAKVYVNPSLSTEHKEIAEVVRDGEVVLDMFAGIGFFSLNAAKLRKCKCIAVDLNPYAVKYGIESLTLNKLKGDVRFFLGSAEEFLEITKDKSFDVTIMNLPHKSHEYVHEARRVTKRLIVAYSVGTREDVIEKFKGLKILNIKKVLDYAPYKYIWRIEIEP